MENFGDFWIIAAFATTVVGLWKLLPKMSDQTRKLYSGASRAGYMFGATVAVSLFLSLVNILIWPIVMYFELKHPSNKA